MKVLVTIERAKDGSYWCQTEDAILGGYLTATGKTVQEAKADLAECLAEARADFEANGRPFPDVEFTYKYDLDKAILSDVDLTAVQSVRTDPAAPSASV